ncbi:MAG: diguanylate cyclase [Firmicutes bacterium]|nr:diguanylate cyclase [Bacillota bacterium]
MKVGVGYSDRPDSAVAGRRSAEKALQNSGRKTPCDFCLLFSTVRHNQRVLRDAVARVIGAQIPIYGGGAAGVITNDRYGYGGDQVGVACIWLDGAFGNAVDVGGLGAASAESIGISLGKALAASGAKADSSVVLLYDAAHCGKDTEPCFLPASQLLQGMEKSFGPLPDSAVGAGLLGDHSFSATGQFVGGGIAWNRAMALVFGEGIYTDSTIMHGCSPASPFYEVTKADGSVILEINRLPALDFLEKRLDPLVKSGDYPYKLLLGVDYGQSQSAYDEGDYAIRFCTALDRARGGIAVSEDMPEGTEFQIMYRSLDPAYMSPRIDALFGRVAKAGREPVLAMYFDGMGRCAGYGGTDIEDAIALQQAVAGRAPVFGIYTGSQIATVAGVPRGINRSGVLCLFSQERKGGKRKAGAQKEKSDAVQAVVPPRAQRGESPSVEFVCKMCEQDAAKILSLDAQLASFRQEFELKRRGFRLISELSVSIRQTDNYENVFAKVARRINTALNMQKTIVLFAEKNGLFVPGVLQGFSESEWERLSGQPIRLPEELLESHPVVVNGADSPERFKALRAHFSLPFFVSSSIFMRNEVSAVLITGRTAEQLPFLSRLGFGDAETVQALAELVGSVLVRIRLHDVIIKAETDSLTELWNRDTFQRLVQNQLDDARKHSSAFFMMDIDFFKSINDTYGHAAGDEVLIACSEAMRKVLRDTDIIGRLGGDEFAVFCRGIGEPYNAEHKAEQILRAWKEIVPKGGSKSITGSIGIAMVPQHGVEFNELYNNADIALYKAKEKRDHFEMFLKGE